MLSAKRSKRSFPYKHELKVLLLSIVSVLVFISLYSYNPHDPCRFFYSSQSHEITNQCGSIGAQVAALLFYLFGVAAFLVIPFIMFLTYLELQRRPWSKEWERVVFFGVLVATVAALCNIHRIDPFYMPLSGGYIGYMVTSFLYRLFDYIGALVLLYALLHVCLVILFRFSFIHVIQYGIHYGQRLVHYMIHAYKWAVRNRVVPRIYYAIKIIVVYGIIKPVSALGRFGTRLLDGSAFEGTGMRGPLDQPAKPVEPYRAPYVMRDPIKPSRQLSLQEIEDPQPEPEPEPIKKYHQANFISESAGESMAIAVEDNPNAPVESYGLPSLDIFIGVDDKKEDAVYRSELQERAAILEEKLQRFGVCGKVVSIKNGPVVTLFEYKPEIDTKLSKILALEDDLALALKALSIRIIAPIPGRSVVGFEVSNQDRKDVLLAKVIQSSEYQDFTGALPLILGEDTIGDEVVVDLAKMPHLLVAGSTGSGKSVALNAMLISLLCKCKPEELKLILIDPKRLEFASYTDIAHLLFPIVTDPRKTAPILRWVVRQMEHRYEKMAEYNARNIFDYNKMAKKYGTEQFPFIVVVIDELSDLMLTVGREIEDLITRITQMARAAGIHMIVATQRPSVDVITGLIKVNFPSRISFRVTSKADSRTILDCGGADKLLGRGDSLFLDSTASTLNRVHGAYVSDQEIERVVSHIHAQQEVEYLDINEEMREQSEGSSHEDEELFNQVLEFIQEIDEVSISLLQRKFRIGYNRSARIIDMLEARGLIMPADGGKARRVIRS